jgi:hypothetical protein
MQHRLHKFIALKEQAKDLYTEMDGILEEVLRSPEHRDLTITINGKQIGLINNFAEKNISWKATCIRQFDIGEVKPPRNGNAESGKAENAVSIPKNPTHQNAITAIDLRAADFKNL